MTFSHPSISFVTPRAGKLTRKTILNRFHSLFAPRRIEIFITTTYAQLREGVAVEVIHGLAVPGAVGGGDRDEQAGSDAVGTRHGRRGSGNVSIGAAGEDEATQAAEDEGAQAAEGEGAVGHEPMQQSRCQGLTPPARGFFTY